MVTKLNAKEIQDAMRKKYAEISRTAKGKFNYPTGKEGAANLKYDVSDVETIPADVLESFCGVGTGRMTGWTGRACGIDLTPEMVMKTQKTITQLELTNCEVKLAESESIPYDDHTFDMVISNGVLNMSPDKEKSFQEIYRVLKPGGRLQFADIVLKKDLPEKVANSLEAWTD
jgi:ubiquinone/menaquinone biosynthesis C-methylase UbiE